MSQHSDERGAELREIFFESAQELLQSLNEEALKLEKQSGDAETVRVIRRIVHTLKGDSAACGFRELSELSHELEDILGLETASSHASLAEIAFTAADTFAALLAAYRNQAELPSLDPLRKMMRELAEKPDKKGRKKKAAAAHQRTVWTEYEMVAMQNATERGKRVYHITGRIDANCAMPIAARQMVLNTLSALGEVLGARPQPGSPESSASMEFLLASDTPAEQIIAKCQIPTIVAQVKAEVLTTPANKQVRHDSNDLQEQATASQRLQKSDVVAAEPGEEPELAAPSSPSYSLPENVLRVDAERIDSVLNLVGELIIGKSMLQQALNEFSKIYPKAAIRSRFLDAMGFQARVLNDLQRSVMKIRMVPVEQLFRRFPRVVRDIAKQCGKAVDLKISGQDTDLDKSILDAISEPLTHIVRNAVGHGIEDPEQRRRVGKPARGTIRLNAYHHGNQVIVEVSDDGGGIDPQRIKAKALEKGLIAAESLERMTEAELMDLVFHPGFTTAEEITEVSGRGVGLDVVQTVLHRLKGSVHIETRLGQSTTFRLKLPLTLAIIKALLFRVQHRLYAVPLNTVAEIARAAEADVHQVDNYEVLQLRNQVLPMVRLGDPPAQQLEGAAGKIFVLVISVGERKCGLIVDSLEGEEELVIKALDDHTVATDMVSGASILGDGRVVLILNIAALLERYSKSRPGSVGKLAPGLLTSSESRAARLPREVPQ